MPLSKEEEKIIYLFAKDFTQKSIYKDRAINIYYNHLKEVNSSIELQFMSEVDNAVPDLMLRSMYRKKILEKYNAKIK